MFRLGLVIALFFVIGAAVSGLAALRIHEQDKHIEQAAFDRAVEAHSGSVQERLSERELLAEVSVSLFRPPPAPQIRALDPLRDAIRAFRADFFAISWIRTIEPGDVEQALEILRSEGVSGFQSRALANTPPPDGQPQVILDIEPRDPATVRGLGVDIRTVPVWAQALEVASRTSRPAATDPVRIGGNGSFGVALIAPAFGPGSKTPTGYISFSFGFGSWLLSNSSTIFIAALKDPRSGMPGELSINGSSGEIVTSAPLALPSTVQRVNFGGRDWEFVYYRRQDPTQRIFWTAMSAFLVGLALTSVVCGLFGYVAYNNLRLSREIESRVSFERRLGAVIGELNHRVKNLLAVIQSIVTRTLRPGSDLNSSRDLLIGRIHAMSHVVSLLSESEWQGARLKGLLESRAIPNSERMVATGPDITVSARAAQSLSLLFFELANHAGDTVLADPDRFNVVVQWTVSGEGPGAVFNLRWEEFNTSPATRREETEFGAVLLDRVAPEALGGKSQRYFTDASYVYELTAPLETVIDRTERERTDRMARLADQQLP